MPTFADMMRTHPQHRGDLWMELDLLYRGGSDLMEAILIDGQGKGPRKGRELLVKRIGEPDSLYAERCRRAYALPNLPTIVNYFAAVTLSDPPIVKEKGKDAPDGWYAEFQRNVDRAGTDLAKFMRAALVKASVCRVAHVIVDFPPVAPAPGDREPTRADEDALGARDGYFCPCDPWQVLDWEKDEEGRYLWAVVHSMRMPRSTFDAKRDTVVHEWRVFARGEAGQPATARLFRAETKAGEPAKAGADVALVSETPLRTSRVPIVALELPHGLWIGGKIGPAERELLNKQNALSWLEYMTAFAFLKEQRIAPGQGDDSPAPSDGVVKTYRIIPNVGAEDVSWVELSGSSITVLSDRLFKLTESIYRQVNQLALAAPLGAADQAASGEAKRRDARPTAVVCEALAGAVRDFTEELFDVLAEGRGEEPDFEVGGLRRFDASDDLVSMLRGGVGAQIPSETARKEIALRLVDAVLPDLDPEQRARIRAEIEASQPPEPGEGDEEGAQAPERQRPMPAA